jgi:hypothetical protein
VVQVVLRPQALCLDLGVDLHGGPFLRRYRIAPDLALAGGAVLPLDVGMDQLDQISLGERLTECS